MSFQLQPHQTRNAEQLVSALRSFGGALDGSDTGTGKTISFLSLCKQLGARPAVVSYKTILPAWHDACRMVGVDPVFIANYEACKSRNFPFGKTISRVDRNGVSSVTGYEWVLPEKRVLFCFDEAQALRAGDSINSKMALAARRQFKTCLLSATPFQTPLEAGTIGQIIGMFGPSEYYRWLFKHGCKKNFMGYMEFVGDKKDWRDEVPGTNALKGAEIMARIHADIFPLRGCRTRREEIPGFPETLITCDAIETGESDAITAAYEAELKQRREEDHARACEDVDPEFHSLVEVLPIVRDLRHRQEAEAKKCRAMAEMAKLAHDKGESVALFVNFDQSVTMLSEYLDCPYFIRGDGTGKTKNNFNRKNVVDYFQANKIPYVIVNSAAGGVGLSLHDPVGKKPRTTLISPPHSAVRLKQIFGRPHRLGGGFSTQRVLFAAGTIEERVMARVQTRLRNLDALCDGDLDIL